jgi:hypothetical protein
MSMSRFSCPVCPVSARLAAGRCDTARPHGSCISARCCLGCGTPYTSSQPSPGGQIGSEEIRPRDCEQDYPGSMRFLPTSVLKFSATSASRTSSCPDEVGLRRTGSAGPASQKPVCAPVCGTICRRSVDLAWGSLLRQLRRRWGQVSSAHILPTISRGQHDLK